MQRTTTVSDPKANRALKAEIAIPLAGAMFACAWVFSAHLSAPRAVQFLLALLLAGGAAWCAWTLRASAAAAAADSVLAQEFRHLKDSHRALEEQSASASAQAEELAAANARLREMQSSLEASYQHLAQMNSRLEQQATTDAMTGLANHRTFQELVRSELSQAGRLQLPMALLMADVDNFKQYNDTFGHPAGDEILKTVASLLKSGTRIGDTVARYGGEEFAVLLPATDFHTAQAVAERLRLGIASHTFPHRAITVSIGVAPASLVTLDAETLVSDADEALYLAKTQGRNRVCAASPRFQSDIDAVHLVTENPQEVQKALDAPVARIRKLRQAVAQDSFGGLEGILQESTGPVLAALLGALDLRDHESPGHPQRVARYALRLALEVAAVLDRRRQDEPLLPQVTPYDLHNLAIGSLLHDIGNIRIPDHILRKAGGLSDAEVAMLRRHPRFGAEFVGDFALLEHALPVIMFHHERWDGEGYPYGIGDEEIPLTARIFCVGDALDAMTTDKPYRKRLSFAIAREEIRMNAGKQFDPIVVEAFLQVPESEWRRLQASGEQGLPLDTAA
jgi:diguanylate cyclase (GGDEF)-like protein